MAGLDLLGSWTLHADNGSPQGIAEANGEVVVVDLSADEVYRYDYDGTYILSLVHI